MAVGVAIVVALGVGASMAVLTVYNNVFLRSRTYADPEQLVILENRGAYALGQDIKSERAELSWPDFQDLETQQTSLSAIGGIGGPERLVWDAGGRLRSVVGVFVTPKLLELLGIQAVAGRTLQIGDFAPEATRVALVTEGLWRRHLGSDPAVIGQAFRVEREAVVIVGVIRDDVVASLRQRQELFEDADRNARLVLPFLVDGDGPAGARLALRRSNRVFPMLTVVGRLKPGSPLEVAEREVSTVSARLAREFPESNSGRTIHAVPFIDWVTNDVKHLQPMLVAVAILALVVSCASAIGFMMADAVRTEPEMAVRHALGASRRALAALILQRSMSRVCLGGLLGVPLAWLMLRWIDVVGSDGRAALRLWTGPELFANAAGLSFLTGLSLGTVGVWMLGRQDFCAGIREAGSSSSASRRRRVALSIVVGAQVAIATSLGFVSILLLRSLMNVYNVDLGFQPGQSFLIRVQLPQEHYSTASQQAAFFDQALARARGVPGVAAVALGDAPPLSQVAVTIGSSDFALEVPNRPPQTLPPLGGQRVSASYFETLGMRVVRGRGFSDPEVKADAPVLVVDEGFWRARFGDVDPLQSVIRIGGTRHNIIGVVAGTRQSGPTSAARPTVYLPRHLVRAPNGYLIVRPRADARVLSERVAAEVASLDSRVLVDDPQMLATLLARSVAARQRMLRLLTIAAGIVLLLTAFSVAGVLGEFVENRVREIALRKALGASRRHTLLLVCRNVGTPAAAGLLCGSAGGFFLAKALSSELFGVAPLDVVTLVGTVAGLTAIGVAAASGPIKRAWSIDPARALRMV